VPAVTAPLQPIVDVVTDTVAPLIPVVTEPLQPVIDAVAPLIPVVTEPLQPVIDAVAPLVPVVTEPLQPVIDAVAPIVTTVTDPLKPVVDVVGPVVRPIVAPIAPILDPVTPARPDSRPVDSSPAPAPSVTSPQGGSRLDAPVQAQMPTDSFVAPAPVDSTGAAPTQGRNTAPAAAGRGPIAAPSTGSYLTTVLPATLFGASPVMPTPRNDVPAPVPPAPASGGSSDSVPPLNTGMSPFGAAAGPSPVPPGGSALALDAASRAAALLLTRFTTAPTRWRSVLVVSLIERPG
jgi:hypothetical protein